MISTIDLRGQTLSARELQERLPRAEIDVSGAIETVLPLVKAVRERGGAALREQAEEFDGVRPTNLRVPAAELRTALENLDPAVRTALERAAANLRRVHDAQVPRDFTTSVGAGAQVRQRWIPIRRVGLYVPGGLAVYPSSVLMNVIAAQSAGVESLAVTSPAQAAFAGLPHPTILAACQLLGVEEVYAVGGAGAVAMFAYGATGLSGGDASGNSDDACEPVDIITGPGNVWVTAAKRAVMGTVGIDAEAGPTEIAILADAQANARYVAADLISQAEHDPLAGSVLVTDAPELADAVQNEIARQAAAAKHSERIATALGGKQSAIVVVDDLDQGMDVIDAYAAEHLEIHTVDARERAQLVKNAGAIFVGDYSPVSLGDYAAGSNHVLPTGGSARFSSGLGVHSFLRAVQVIEFDEAALHDISSAVIDLSHAEDLPAHGAAVEARLS
ncbi:MAG TPA: histidinol dehydrogenase [Actinomycetales bacterium]|nr:histidinol dehydrogenase [Actinomycetales bacterium]